MRKTIEPNRVCEFCGVGFHIKPAYVGRFCSRACKGKSQRVFKKRCAICGRELSRTTGSKTGKYCSYECFGKSLRTRRRVVCSHCGKEFERKPFQLARSRRAFCSRECCDAEQRKGREEHICKTCGARFSRHGRRKYGYCSSGCSRTAQQHRAGLNKLEMAGGDILRGMGLVFEEQVLLFGKFTVDVLVRSCGLVIQWDGDYWHGNPKVFRNLTVVQESKQKHDKASNAYLRKCGMKVLRFWERDVKRRPEWVVSEIEKAMGG